MAPPRPLYPRLALAVDLLVRDANAGRGRRVAAPLRAPRGPPPPRGPRAGRVRRLAALLRAHGVRPPARILDAGCGTGNYARALARLGYRVVGVDRSVRLLADARAKTVGAGPVFVRADLTTYRPAAPFAA